jgi:hypothetical protein
VDVGGFAEPRKILCQSDLPSVEQLSVHPRSAHGGAGFPQQTQQLELLNSLIRILIWFDKIQGFFLNAIIYES